MVRSLSLPKNGLANIASRAPTPATSARLFGALSVPTSELTFNAKLTSRGARNSRTVPMYANAYSEMNPHSTRYGTVKLRASGRLADRWISRPRRRAAIRVSCERG